MKKVDYILMYINTECFILLLKTLENTAESHGKL